LVSGSYVSLTVTHSGIGMGFSACCWHLCPSIYLRELFDQTEQFSNTWHCVRGAVCETISPDRHVLIDVYTHFSLEALSVRPIGTSSNDKNLTASKLTAVACCAMRARPFVVRSSVEPLILT
jgi:hypothetical protein